MYISVRGFASLRREPGAGVRVPRPVLALGLVSLLTDVSSESVTSILPLYVTSGLGLSFFAYGVIDGLHQGASTLVRLPAGWLADRTDNPKPVALVGYVVSALTRIGLVIFTGISAIGALVTVDRLGKGFRTAPRDALIVLSAEPGKLGRAFGVHRALDTVGACLGPVMAFLVLLAVPGDYSSVFVVSFAFGLLGVLALLTLVPGRRQRSATRYARVRLRSLVTGGTGSLAVVAAVLSMLSIGDGLVYLALLENDAVSIELLPLLALGTNLVYLALAVPLGMTSDRIGRPRMFVLGHVALASCYLVTCVGSTLLVAILAVGCLGAYYASTDGLLAAVSGERAQPGAAASTIAATQTVVALGRLVASAGFGALWLALGSGALVAFAAALAVVVPVSLSVLRRSERAS